MAPQRAFKTLIWQYAGAWENRTGLLACSQTVVTQFERLSNVRISSESFLGIRLPSGRSRDLSRWPPLMTFSWTQFRVVQRSLAHRNQITAYALRPWARDLRLGRLYQPSEVESTIPNC
jgi:hypothetical protein